MSADWPAVAGMQLGRFLRRTGMGYAHWCPGCERMHGFAVDEPLVNGARWTFDGNIESPTFNPSMNIGPDEERCHYFLHAGQLKYQGDCRHPLVGQTVAVPELPVGMRDR